MHPRGNRPGRSPSPVRGAAVRSPAPVRVVTPTGGTPAAAAAGGLGVDRARTRMVETVQASGVRDPDVLSAMHRVPRHAFVEAALASRAYEDVALPIGHGQTISRPTTVGRMLELVLAQVPAGRRGEVRALEVGTGCGYQAAVLAQIVGEVVSVERLRALHESARANLRSLRQGNLRLVFGDGRLGVPQAAPFDAIVVAAAGEAIPDDLLLQMRVGGRLVAPITSAGSGTQSLHLVERAGEDDWHLTVLDPVRFVPLRAGTR